MGWDILVLPLPFLCGCIVPTAPGCDMLTAYADLRVLTVTALLIQGMFRNSVQANVISLSLFNNKIHHVCHISKLYNKIYKDHQGFTIKGILVWLQV